MFKNMYLTVAILLIVTNADDERNTEEYFANWSWINSIASIAMVNARRQFIISFLKVYYISIVWQNIYREISPNSKIIWKQVYTPLLHLCDDFSSVWQDTSDNNVVIKPSSTEDSQQWLHLKVPVDQSNSKEFTPSWPLSFLYLLY